ncbi:glycosyltransferase [Synechococcus sp. PCC 7335]|uniref:glycosyltransferase family 2 protein n=1 Tax=Synechococcus sp. (strain ATCC 29403 / PCC 7335) TaxID=91464 RepID=UPI0002D9840D|nr:glycosyltransferase [Synechococcus sp. PCC 7335]
MKISVGILAYNEADCIEATIRSLLAQSVFQPPYLDCTFEIIVVPNGCTDDTSTVSYQALTKLTSSIPDNYLSWQICEVAQAGKPNAWDYFVHEFAIMGRTPTC